MRAEGAQAPRLAPASRAEWRSWPAAHDGDSDGAWVVVDRVEALAMPGDLAGALAMVPGAAEGFAAMAASLRKQYLYWVLSAKRHQTRAARVAAVVAAARGVAIRPD